MEESNLTIARSRKKIELKFKKWMIYLISMKQCQMMARWFIRAEIVNYQLDAMKITPKQSKFNTHLMENTTIVFYIGMSILSDNYIGKYPSIIVGTCFCTASFIVLTISSVDTLNLPKMTFFRIFVVLNSAGTPGVNTVRNTFEGDQYRLPRELDIWIHYNSLLYMLGNVVITVAMLISPTLKYDFHCFGKRFCYFLPFAVGTFFSLFILVFFLLGTQYYRIIHAEKYIMCKALRCTFKAIELRRTATKKRPHWLDYAKPVYGKRFVRELKMVYNLGLICTSLPIFNALLAQFSTTFMYQSKKMNWRVGTWYTLHPDYVYLLNPISCIIICAMCQYILLPIAHRLVFFSTPLRREGCAFVLVLLGFSCTAILSYVIELKEIEDPKLENSQLTLYNNLHLPIILSVPSWSKEGIHLQSMEHYTKYNINQTKENHFNYSIRVIGEGNVINGTFKFDGATAIGYYFGEKESLISFKEDLQKDLNRGRAKIFVLLNATQDFKCKFQDEDGKYFLSGHTTRTKMYFLPDGQYKFIIDDISVSEIDVLSGGIYRLLVREIFDNEFKIKLIEVKPPNSIHILWQIPQIILFAASEVLNFMTEMTFPYSQAPRTMKVLAKTIWICWFTLGNLVVVMVESIDVPDEAINDCIYVILMILNLIYYYHIAMRYKYISEREMERQEGLNTQE